RLMTPRKSPSEAGALLFGSYTMKSIVGLVGSGLAAAFNSSAVAFGSLKAGGNLVARTPTFFLFNSSTVNDSCARFSSMKSMEMGFFSLVRASSSSGSSTATISKFCILWAVGAQRPASRMLRRSASAKGRLGSKGPRADCLSWSSLRMSVIAMPSFARASHLQSRPEMHLRRHHLLVGESRLLEGEDLDHGDDSGEDAEIDGVPDLPGPRSDDGSPAADEHARMHLEHVPCRPDDDRLSVAPQSADQLGDGLCVGGGAQDHLRPAKA